MNQRVWVRTQPLGTALVTGCTVSVASPRLKPLLLYGEGQIFAKLQLF